MNRLRFKLYLTILPLVTLSIVLSGLFASLWSRMALTRAANRHLAYKAEQLRDYINGEWEVLESLRLADKEEYRSAAKNSFRSYAYSLIRNETEQILVFNADSVLIQRIGLESHTEQIQEETSALPVGTIPRTGWFLANLYGEERVGVSFPFDPFGWVVAITELKETFFLEVKRIQITHIVLLTIVILIVTILIAIFVRHIVGPLERLVRTIEHIKETGDLGFRARIEYADEIGLLAERFNSMIDTIQADQARLEDAFLIERKSKESVRQREYETLLILGRISDYRDEKTGAHLKRIGSFAVLFAQIMGKDKHYQELLEYSAPLHDIGKISIPDSILLKPGKLTEEEFEIVKKHSIWGYELLKDTQSVYLMEGAVIALSHHEKWDGSGYPKGLAGEDIPLSGRIVGLIDVYDSLISERPYKAPWEPEKALQYIKEQKGKHFDPQLVELFEKHFLEFLQLG